MNIIDIFHNDDLATVIKKCNENFRQLSWSINQTNKLQSIADMSDVTQALSDMQAEINRVVTQDVPNEVSSQIAAADIPQLVEDEVASQIPLPPVGSYLLMASDPSTGYPGTHWQQVDTMTTDGNVTIPLWQRTVI